HYPLASSWNSGLFPYHKKSSGFHCPAVLQFGYAMNGALSGRNITIIPDDEYSTTPQFFESRLQMPNASGRAQAWLRDARHPQGSLAAFTDGHVEWLAKP